MGRQRSKNNRRRGKNNRKRTQPCREISIDDKNSKPHLVLANPPLPLGAYTDMDSFTTLYLFGGDEKSREEWNRICLQLILFCSKEVLFDDIKKCIAYIRRKHITHLYLHVLNSNATAIKNIRETITNACNRNNFIHFYITGVSRIRFGRRGMAISGTHDDDNAKRQYDNSEMPVPMAIYGLSHGQQKSIQDLTKDEIRFMWFQLLLDILLRLPRNTATMEDMLDVARAHYSTDPTELRKIDQFAHTYHSTKAIWWYTQDSFVYRLLNSAFRTQDIRIIFTFRFYILDLYTQLADKAAKGIDCTWHTVFRGQMLPVDELEMIKKNIGGLISMNTFPSTTLDCQVACMYAGYGSSSLTHDSVLYEITQNSDSGASLARPFASIASYSDKHDENEILFGMGSIFRVVSVEQYDSMCLVNLEIHNQPKECITEFSAVLRAGHEGRSVDEISLGDLLLEMGEIKQAEQFYSIMIGQQNPDQFEIEIARLQNSIGSCYLDKGDYKSSRVLFEQALILANNDQSLKFALLNNLGLAWLNQGDYGRALKCFKKSKKCKRSKMKIGVIYLNMSSVYIEKGQYEPAKLYAHRALSIEKKYLPASHPDLAQTYNHLAFIEQRMGNYRTALDLFEQSLIIYRQCLPPNHHLFAHALNNTGATYNDMDDFDRALENYEQALKIQSTSFGHNKDTHLLVAKTLNNIATCQFAKNDFQGAETTFKRVLETKLAIFGENSTLHPSLAIAYNNLAIAQMKQSRFDEAMINYTRTLAIEQSIGDATSICVTYNNMGGIYDEKGDFANAERLYLKAYTTTLTALPSDHPSVQLYARHMEKARIMMATDNVSNV